MEKTFWLERWERQETGFHQHDVNADLRAFWNEVTPVPGEQVFVPLCGKSRDMLWLANQGHRVVGVELSRLAVESFFLENDIPFQWNREGSLDAAAGGGIRIFCGDLFELTAKHVGAVSVAYDRAALVALPPVMRERYVSHLRKILQPGARILLISLDYPENEIDGPPFAVSRSEVERLYRAFAEVRMLGCRDILPDSPRFAERGVTSMQSCAYLVRD